ncbi:methyltransferase domain-containing protein [Flagellimonas hymeniacidonis]|uniref:Methyltransferase domain-containing protein n=1 Tax=Flagellimonas hymeniacidonis TaxID=2603628 RepID=A0A5C8V2G4_9FLAO|nr:class I SAM-dependent methyltransferase [Flagellimonas hymeniacidonis]TXN35566.1 methyltransferase domain-containing protein [Flagellimonas hymeniacidonis]
MDQTNILDAPSVYPKLLIKSQETGFSMPSDVYIGTLLKTLIASKPKGKFLELGTGIGLSLSWMLEGMDEDSQIISVDNDEKLIAIAQDFFGEEKRLCLVCDDGEAWLSQNQDERFDLIFADAWPGKYSCLNKVLSLVKPGGFYVIDDMVAQPNWPDGHEEKAIELVKILEEKENFTITKMNWSTGVLVAVKTK